MGATSQLRQCYLAQGGWSQPLTLGQAALNFHKLSHLLHKGCARGGTGPCLRDEETEAERDNMLTVSQWQRSDSTALNRHVNLPMVTIKLGKYPNKSQLTLTEFGLTAWWREGSGEDTR